MLTAYSVYLALSNQDYEVNAESIEKNSDCGRLNLLCPCCHERVYWNNRKNVKFFSHFPNSESSANCERYTNATSREKRKKSFMSALNKEKTQYEKYFWEILTQVYKIFSIYETRINDCQKIPEVRKYFEKLYYPKLKENQPILTDILNQLYTAEIQLNESVGIAGKNEKIFKMIRKKTTKRYREVIVNLLFSFLLQKRSKEIVYKIYITSVLFMFEQNNYKLPNPNDTNKFAINQLFCLIAWCPWEEAINDIRCFGKVLPKHQYTDDFGGFLINVVAQTNGENIPCILTLT